MSSDGSWPQLCVKGCGTWVRNGRDANGTLHECGRHREGRRAMFEDASLLVQGLAGGDEGLIWTCVECGALVIDIVGSDKSRKRHERWHAGVNRSINEASPDFVGY